MTKHYSYFPITSLDELQEGDIAVMGNLEHQVVKCNGNLTVWVKDLDKYVDPILCAQLGAEFRRPRDLDPLPIHPGVIIRIWRDYGAETFVCLGDGLWSPIGDRVSENALLATAKAYGGYQVIANNTPTKEA